MSSAEVEKLSLLTLAREVALRTLRFLGRWVVYLGPAASTLVLAWVAGEWDSRWVFALFPLACLIGVAVLTGRQQEGTKKLQIERDEANVNLGFANQQIKDLEREIEDTERALELVLSSLVRELAITLKFKTPQDRVSVYFHSGSEFVMAARYSADPIYQAAGRVRYPDSQGLISKAWRNEVASVKYQNEHEWRSAQVEDFKFTDDVVDAFNMKSLSMVGVRLECNKKFVGVLVIESTNSEGATQRIANLMQRNAAGVSIAELLQNHSARVPGLRVSSARR